MSAFIFPPIVSGGGPGGGLTEEEVQDLIDDSLAGLASEVYVDNAVLGLATVIYVDAAVADLATTDYVDASVLGLASESYVDSAVAGLATETFVLDEVAGLATETYVDDAINALVGAAPGALNTLDELAAAINDDANVYATLVTMIGGKANTSHVHAWADITSGKPTTLAGYGITDAAGVSHTHAWSAIVSGTPTTLAGYGIVDAQPLNATLTAVAGGTYTGATSITTLGTIATGVWSGTTIALNKGGTGATTAGAAATALGLGTGDTPTFSGATLNGNILFGASSGAAIVTMTPSNTYATAQNQTWTFSPKYNNAGTTTAVANVRWRRNSTVDGAYPGDILFQTRTNGSALADALFLDEFQQVIVGGNTANNLCMRGIPGTNGMYGLRYDITTDQICLLSYNGGGGRPMGFGTGTLANPALLSKIFVGLNFAQQGGGAGYPIGMYMGSGASTNGISSASPVAFPMLGQAGVGTNIPGADGIVGGGPGTGNATASKFICRGPTATTSGTTVQTLSDIFQADTTSGLVMQSTYPVRGLIKPNTYTVGTLPTAGLACRVAYASNGRKAGEGAAAGTGCPVWDDGTNWKTFYDNSNVAA